MADISGDVEIRLDGLKQFGRTVHSDVRNRSSGPIRDAIVQWGVRYRSFVMRRFVRYSRGGGDWAPLKAGRARGALSAAAILRDTGLLLGALNPEFVSSPGALQEGIPFGVRVGYGGPGRYPSGASIADIARFHQLGEGYNPKREIIVKPDAATISRMADDMQRAMIKLGVGLTR
jgi:hypothetical protein